MKRRSFFATLAGLAIAPKIAPKLLALPKAAAIAPTPAPQFFPGIWSIQTEIEEIRDRSGMVVAIVCRDTIRRDNVRIGKLD